MAKKNAVVKPLTKVGVAREYRDKHGMEMPTLKLARIMYNENKLLFNSLDHARSTLRMIEGKSVRKSGGGVTHPAPERPRKFIIAVHQI